MHLGVFKNYYKLLGQSTSQSSNICSACEGISNSYCEVSHSLYAFLFLNIKLRIISFIIMLVVYYKCPLALQAVLINNIYTGFHYQTIMTQRRRVAIEGISLITLLLSFTFLFRICFSFFAALPAYLFFFFPSFCRSLIFDLAPLQL